MCQFGMVDIVEEDESLVETPTIMRTNSVAVHVELDKQVVGWFHRHVQFIGQGASRSHLS